MSAPPMYVWTIYDDPVDFPGRFVVRRFRIRGANPEPEAKPWSIKGSLPEARGTVPAGLIRISRARDDEPHIVECWL